MEGRTKKLIRIVAIAESVFMAGLIALHLYCCYFSIVLGQERGRGDSFLVMFLMSALGSVAIALLGIVLKEYRVVFFYLLVGIIANAAVLVFYSNHAGRLMAFRKVARDTAPLVAAINRYDNKYGKPPDDLSALVPEFLPALSDKGFYRYRGFKYSPREELGNPWTIEVPYVFDTNFYYYPKQNYDEDQRIKGTSWHNIEGWAVKFG